MIYLLQVWDCPKVGAFEQPKTVEHCQLKWGHVDQVLVWDFGYSTLFSDKPNVTALFGELSTQGLSAL